MQRHGNRVGAVLYDGACRHGPGADPRPRAPRHVLHLLHLLLGGQAPPDPAAPAAPPIWHCC